jgi:hypothetical protein
MIKSLSPYNLTIPFVAPLSGLTCTEFQLEIFVWNGSKSTPPIEPSYEKTIANPTASIGNAKVNIARLVNDFIDFTPYDTLVSELVNGNNQQWVKTQVLYVTADEYDYIPQLENTILMVKGYGYGMDGANAQPPTNNIFLSGTEFKVQRNGYFVLPILIEETVDVSTLVLDSVVLDTGSTYDYSFTSSFVFTQLYAQVRPVGNPTWGTATLFAGITSPQSRVVSITPFETRIFAFNTLTGNNIYSNTITV